MRFIRRNRPSPALLIASLALFVSIGGTSYAVITVGSSQIINDSVRSVDLKNGDVRSVDIKNGSLRAVDFRPGELPSGAAGASGRQGPAGAPGSTGPQGPVGPSGSASTSGADMYAHVGEDAAIDPGRSSAGIDATAVAFNSFFVYCFDLPQPVVNISATLEDTSSTFMGQFGITLSPLNATVVSTEIAAYPCPVSFRDAAVLVGARQGPDKTSLYATFL